MMASICLNAESAFDYRGAFENVRRFMATQSMSVSDALTAAAGKALCISVLNFLFAAIVRGE